MTLVAAVNMGAPGGWRYPVRWSWLRQQRREVRGLSWEPEKRATEQPIRWHNPGERRFPGSCSREAEKWGAGWRKAG